MGQVRKAIELGHALRKQEAIKVRQPLSDIFYSFGGKNEKYDPLIWMDLFKKELNVKLVVYGESHHAPVHSGHWVSATHSIAPGDISVSLRIDLNDQLIAEGQAREIVRQIQDARKVAGTAMDEIVVTALPDWPANFEDYIKKETLSQELKKGDTLEIIRTKT
jgi:hypothetical protein